MAHYSPPEKLSEDEIFFGKSSVKDLNKRLFPDDRPETMCGTEMRNDENICIIETHSEPDVCSVSDSVISPDCSNASASSSIASKGLQTKSEDDSFLKLEAMINELNNSPYQNALDELDNTFDIVDFILKNPPAPIENKKGKEEILLKATDYSNNCSEEGNKIIVETAKTTNDNSNTHINSVKKRLFPDDRPQTMCGTEMRNDENICIIETHSEPDVCSVSDSVISPDCSNASASSSIASKGLQTKSEDDSFLKLEAMINELDNSPYKNALDELDNTFDIVDFILKNPPVPIENKKGKEEILLKATDYSNNCSEEGNKIIVETAKTTNDNSNTPINSVKSNETLSKVPSSLTPLTEKEVFKSPKTPILKKKNETPSLGKTPGKTNAFQHITSPVAAYIRNSPQVPLLRNVRPTKPLPSTSSIPEVIKKTNNDKGKENFQLPSVAYRNAKRTITVTIPDKKKLPQSSWAKKVASSQSKPVVIKHDHRVVTSVRAPVFTDGEDSLADSQLQQADVSVCIQKSAGSK